MPIIAPQQMRKHSQLEPDDRDPDAKAEADGSGGIGEHGHFGCPREAALKR
jgi:hypothetical protein